MGKIKFDKLKERTVYMVKRLEWFNSFYIVRKNNNYIDVVVCEKTSVPLLRK